jgi:hypothetical protein
MRRCPDLAVKGIDNFHIDDSDNLHALFSADIIEAGGEDADADVDPQERALAQRGRSKPTGVWGLLDPTISTLTPVQATQVRRTVSFSTTFTKSTEGSSATAPVAKLPLTRSDPSESSRACG